MILLKKYIIGTLFGFVLATAIGANAQGVTKLIDQVVQGVFPVTVDGTSIGEAVVIDNKTYLPVREFGEAVGYKVTFTGDREVVLTKNTDTTVPNVPVTPTPTPTHHTMSNDDIQAKIEYYESLIKTAKWNISSFEDNIKNNPSVKDDEFRKTVVDLKTKITDYETQISALEKQKQ